MESKYDDKTKPFLDPVVRCTECQKLLFRDDPVFMKVGKCFYCGCHKVRQSYIFSDSEILLMKNKKVDPEFIACYEPLEGT